MAVRVQCPHCRSVCEVQPQLLGTTVKCGKCTRPFALPAGTSAPRPAAAAPTPAQAVAGAATAAPRAPAAFIPPPSPPGPPAADPGALGSGLWRSLRDLYRSMTTSGAAAAGAPSSRPPTDDSIELELDGPTAVALAAATQTGGKSAAAPPGLSRLDVGSSSSCGMARTRNEDSCLVVQLASSNLDQRRDVALVVLADGMGGYEAGDQASGLAIRLIGSALLGQVAPVLAVHGHEKPPAALADAIATAIRVANRAVHEQGQKPGCKGMGATAAVVVVWEGQVLIGHVGDCRVYHGTGGKLRQVTKDQTLVARMVEMGKLTEEEALTHPHRNEVTQALGRHPDIQPAPYKVEIIPGDWLVVACDGLHAHVDEKLLADTLRNAVPSAAALANQLVELANKRGGSDNCTVVAVRCY